MSNKVLTNCSFCKQKYQVKPDLVGKRIRCKKCDKAFLVRTKEQPGPKFDVNKVLGPTENLSTDEMHGLLNLPSDPMESPNANPVSEAEVDLWGQDAPFAGEDRQNPRHVPVAPIASAAQPKAETNRVAEGVGGVLGAIGFLLSSYRKIKLVFLCCLLLLIFFGTFLMIATSFLISIFYKDSSNNAVAGGKNLGSPASKLVRSPKTGGLEGFLDRKFQHRKGRELTYKFTKKVECDKRKFEVSGTVIGTNAGEIKASLGKMVDGEFVPNKNWFQIRYNLQQSVKETPTNSELDDILVKKTEWLVSSPDGTRQSHYNHEEGAIDPLFLMPFGGLGTEWVGSKSFNRTGFRKEYEVTLPIWFQTDDHKLFNHLRSDAPEPVTTPTAKVYIESEIILAEADDEFLTFKKVTTAKSRFGNTNALYGKLETRYRFDLEKGLIHDGSCKGSGKLKISGVTKDYAISANWSLQEETIKTESPTKKTPSKKVVRKEKRSVDFSKFNLKPTAYVFDKSGNLFVASDNQQIVYFDPNAKKSLIENQSREKRSYDKTTIMKLSKNENFLLEVRENGLIVVWSNKRGKLTKVGSFADHIDDKIESVDISDDEKRVVSVDYYGKVRIWKLLERQQIKLLDFEYRRPKIVFFVPNEEKIFAVSADRWWKIDTNTEKIPDGKELKSGHSFNFAVSNDKSMFAVGVSKKVYLYNTKGMRTQFFQIDGRNFKCFAFSSDNKSLFAADRYLYQWDVNSGEQIGKYYLDDKQSIESFILDPMDKKLAALFGYQEGFIIQLKK